MIFKNFFKSPYLLWLKWYLHYIKMFSIHRKKKLRLGYMSTIVNCTIGNNVTIYDYVSLNNVDIGKYSYVGEHSIACATKIGRFCSIGKFVQINLGIHPSSGFVSTHPAFYTNTKYMQESFADKQYFDEFKPLTIGNDVWIGNNATVVGGINIGNGAIIAAGAVVTHDVPAYAIIGGIPAKIISYRFSEEIIMKLEECQWWNNSDAYIKQNFLMFHDITEFINKYRRDENQK